MRAVTVDDWQGVGYCVVRDRGGLGGIRTLAPGGLANHRRKEETPWQEIRHVKPTKATGRAKELLEGVQERLGMTPNMMKVMAASPVVLGGYLSFRSALASGTLDARFREQIALAVAQVNSSEYCLSLHTAVAKRMGLSEGEIAASRQSRSEDGKKDAGLKFASQMVILRGQVGDEAGRGLRAAGYSDAEIVELVANVTLAIFANYFNHVAGTEVDFPKVSTTVCF
jgi:AhpD family alkylhydroperoxidase